MYAGESRKEGESSNNTRDRAVGMTFSNEVDFQAGGSRASNAARKLGTVVKMEEQQMMDQGDNQGDGSHEGGFGYSQKFFHISDGNLYSVFSPLQGRSYGVKPSFLRKHRCTVQETKGKKGGRRNARRGLKFHNFIPSESITSEREEGQTPKSRNKDGRQSKPGSVTDSGVASASREVWKVHAECRLREEHGTKQIMVSNWSLSSDSPAVPKSSASVPSTHQKSITKEADTNQIQNGPLPQNILQLESTETKIERFDAARVREHKQYAKPSVLQQYLEYGKMLPDSDNSAASMDEGFVKMEGHNTDDDAKRRRRKQTTTKRVVPYNKYLSMVDDGPLDLSCQREANHAEEGQFREGLTAMNDSLVAIGSESTNWNGYTHQPETVSLTSPLSKSSVPYNIPMASPYLCPSTITALPYTTSGIKTELNSSTAVQVDGLIYPSTSTSSFLPHPPLTGPLLPPGYMSLPGANQHQMFPNQETTTVIGRSRRKPSQRTIIRQKLEDTFKQNGFLVKTKQVSDGDATFCKFKQLRKYTRYYLKSWHQHLPDEVHKLWKGFLPPKTAMNVPKNGHETDTKGSQQSTPNQEQVIY